MKVSLRAARNPAPMVELVFTNGSPVRQYLAAPRVVPRHMDGGYFEFSPRASFLGTQIKRGPYAAHELIRLHPGERLLSTIDLGQFYDLTAGVPERVRYRATHPVGGPGTTTFLETNWLVLGTP